MNKVQVYFFLASLTSFFSIPCQASNQKTHREVSLEGVYYKHDEQREFSLATIQLPVSQDCTVEEFHQALLESNCQKLPFAPQDLAKASYYQQEGNKTPHLLHAADKIFPQGKYKVVMSTKPFIMVCDPPALKIGKIRFGKTEVFFHRAAKSLTYDCLKSFLDDLNRRTGIFGKSRIRKFDLKKLLYLYQGFYFPFPEDEKEAHAILQKLPSIELYTRGKNKIPGLTLELELSKPHTKLTMQEFIPRMAPKKWRVPQKNLLKTYVINSQKKSPYRGTALVGTILNQEKSKQLTFVQAQCALWYRKKDKSLQFFGFFNSHRAQKKGTNAISLIKEKLFHEAEPFRDYLFRMESLQARGEFHPLTSRDFQAQSVAAYDLLVEIQYLDEKNAPSNKDCVYRRVELSFPKGENSSPEKISVLLKKKYKIHNPDFHKEVKKALVQQGKMAQNDHIYFLDNSGKAIDLSSGFHWGKPIACTAARTRFRFADGDKAPFFLRAQGKTPIPSYHAALLEQIKKKWDLHFQGESLFIDHGREKDPQKFIGNSLLRNDSSLPDTISLTKRHYVDIILEKNKKSAPKALTLTHQAPFTWATLQERLQEKNALFIENQKKSSSPIAAKLFYQVHHYKFLLTEENFAQFVARKDPQLYTYPSVPLKLISAHDPRTPARVTLQHAIPSEAFNMRTLALQINIPSLGNKEKIYFHKENNTLYRGSAPVPLQQNQFRYHTALGRYFIQSTGEVCELKAEATNEEKRKFYQGLITTVKEKNPPKNDEAFTIMAQGDDEAWESFTYDYFAKCQHYETTLVVKKKILPTAGGERSSSQATYKSVFVKVWNELKFKLEEKAKSFFLSQLPTHTEKTQNIIHLLEEKMMHSFPTQEEVAFVTYVANTPVRKATPQLHRFSSLQAHIQAQVPFLGYKIRAITINGQPVKDLLSDMPKNRKSVHRIKLKHETPTICIYLEPTSFWYFFFGTLLCATLGSAASKILKTLSPREIEEDEYLHAAQCQNDIK